MKELLDKNRALEAALNDLMEKHALLQVENANLRERVSDLEARLRKDSSNSGKPPSSDGFKRRVPKSLREKSGRKPGGQPGHDGSNLRMSPSPDRVDDYPAPCACPDCGGSLEGAPVSEERRQVFGFVIVPKVVEHRSEVKSCPGCGSRVSGGFPSGVDGPVQYGSEVKGLAGYLLNRQYLPYKRVSELLGEVFSLPVSPGTLVSWQKSLASSLADVADLIRKTVGGSHAVNFDETSMRADKANHWIHAAVTEKAVHYHFDRNRGREAMDRAGILPEFEGVAVHDRLAAYDTYECGHSLCWEHLRRDLKWLAEERGFKWAGEMLVLFKDMRESIREGEPGRLRRRGFKIRYGKILAAADRENPLPKSGKFRSKRKKESWNLQKAMRKRRNDILLPLDDPLVPPDNNPAERALRIVKIKQKVSGCFRNPEHGGLFAVIASYIETARRNGVNPLRAFADAIAGIPSIPGITC